MANKGVIYYKLESIYDGDITKYCGLSGGEIDGNFFFLRGNDIETCKWKNDEKKLILRKVNGDEIIVDGIEMDINIDGTYYDKDRGVLVLNVNGSIYEIDGFNVEKETKVYSSSNIIGNGTINNPINVSETIKTGFFAPAESFLDLTEDGVKLPSNAKLGDRFLTKENVGEFGLLYNFPAVQSIQNMLSEEASKWRVPTKEDWSEMLNALELCDEDMTHDGELSNKYYGKIAGAYLKNETFSWIKTSVEYVSQENNGSILPSKNSLPSPSYKEYEETILNGAKYEISGISENGTMYFEQYICNNSWDECNDCDITPISALTKTYGFMALPVGVSDFSDGGKTKNFGKMCGFWSIDQDNETDAWVRILQNNKDSVRQQGEATDGHYSLRLVRDYVDEVQNAELINNETYNTILMPYVKKDENGTVYERGNKVWTQQNVSIHPLTFDFIKEKINFIYPKDNNGNYANKSAKYFINYWNGTSWEKREFLNNSMIVLSIGPNGERDEEWQLINGNLYKRSNEIITELVEYVDSELSPIVDKHDRDITLVNDKINSEIEERKSENQQIISKLDDEIEERKENIKLINESVSLLNEKDNEIENRLTEEINRSISLDTELQDKCESLLSKINEEISNRENEDIHLKTELMANDIKFPENEELILDVYTGAIISTNGNSDANIPAKTMILKINGDFGEL